LRAIVDGINSRTLPSRYYVPSLKDGKHAPKLSGCLHSSAFISAAARIEMKKTPALFLAFAIGTKY